MKHLTRLTRAIVCGGVVCTKISSFSSIESHMVSPVHVSPTHLLPVFWHVPDRLPRLHVDKEIIILTTDNLSERFSFCTVVFGFTLCCTTLLLILVQPFSFACLCVVTVPATRFCIIIVSNQQSPPPIPFSPPRPLNHHFLMLF